MRQTRGCGSSSKLGAVLSVGLGVLLVAHAAAAADRGDGGRVHSALAAQPRVKGNLLMPVRRQLALAFRLAREEIRTNPACSALFSRFGADGVELLGKVEFDGATFELLGDTCGRGGVAAFTEVKRTRIRLCPGFGVLSVPAAAVILIHEVLHTAGLSERPVDPKGLTPQEINRLVMVSCSH